MWGGGKQGRAPKKKKGGNEILADWNENCNYLYLRLLIRMCQCQGEFRYCQFNSPERRITNYITFTFAFLFIPQKQNNHLWQHSLLKTTPIPKKIGSQGIQVGVRMPYVWSYRTP